MRGVDRNGKAGAAPVPPPSNTAPGRSRRATSKRKPSPAEAARDRCADALIAALDAAVEAKDVPTLLRLHRHFDELAKAPPHDQPGGTVDGTGPNDAGGALPTHPALDGID